MLLEFEQSVLRIVPVNSEQDNPVVKPLKQQLKAEPVFKELAASDFFDLVKDYFETEDQPLLKELLTSGKEPGTLLLFKDKGNSLADAFKQLFEANLILGCNKVELIHWIIRNFAFLDKGTPKTTRKNIFRILFPPIQKAVILLSWMLKKETGNS